MKTLLTILLSLLSLAGFSQVVNSTYRAPYLNSSYTSGFNIMYAKPASWNSDPTKKYRTLVFFVGAGETGLDATKCDNNGPNYWIANGWDGTITEADSTVEWFVITLQSPTSATVSLNKTMLDTLLRNPIFKNRIDSGNLHISGVSYGGIAVDYINSQTSINKYISTVIPMSSGGLCIANTELVNWVNNYGCVFYLQGNSDALTCNAQHYSATSAAQPDKAFNYIYVGGHWGWNAYYNPGWTGAPGGGSIYHWAGKRSRKAQVRVAEDTINVNYPSTSATLRNTFHNWWGKNSISWTKVSGGTATIASSTADTTGVTGLTAGTSYTFRVTATNSENGQTEYQNVIVNVATSTEPASFAGSDRNTDSTIITLVGAGSPGSGASITGYAWTKISGTGGTITSPTSSTTTVTGLTPGTYVYRLTVTQDDSQTAYDDITVTISAIVTEEFILRIRRGYRVIIN